MGRSHAWRRRQRGDGAEKYDYLSRYNRQAASGLGIKLASGANEMATAERVIARLNELSQYFPHGLEYKVAYETTSFVKASITDVVKTLLEAVLLVFLVMYLFLQNFRATLIPTIAVPVVLMGTFAVLYACGYSINTLTMFAMVLAIGLLVDDAIVVVENVERIMSEEGLSPREATTKIQWGQIRGGAGRYRHGAVSGICANGLLRRHDRRDLSSVLHYYRLCDGAIGTGGIDPHPGAVRHIIKTDSQRRSSRAKRFLRLV
jgi:Cation/multidrug efflux pump